AYEEGTLLYQGVEPGQAVPVNGVIAVIGEEGADFKTLLANEEGGASEAPAEAAPAEEEATSTVESSASADAQSGDRLKASPLARKLAEEKGIDISQVTGSGENGRIVKRDVDNFVPAKAEAAPAAKAPAPAAAAPATPAGSYEDI